MTRVHSLLAETIQRLDNISDQNSRLEAEILLAHALQKPRSWLYTWPEHEPEPTQAAQFEALVAQRIQGVPIAYLTGEREFWSLPLQVTVDTLIPRPETELLVEQALETGTPRHSLRLLDLGTGSGAIAIALASEMPDWQITAVDKNPEALVVARKNARIHRRDTIKFLQSDWFQGIPRQQRFDIVVSNPPYVGADDPHLQQGDLLHEPRTALASGADGLEDLRCIIGQSGDWLDAGGWLLVEHGADQGSSVRKLFADNGYRGIHTQSDLAQRERVTAGQRR